jgi:hypothetical protein
MQQMRLFQRPVVSHQEQLTGSRLTNSFIPRQSLTAPPFHAACVAQQPQVL